jgi:DNA-binding transcriptional MerR regulator
MSGSSPESRSLAISEVADLLGVPMPTLRSWELRYGIPPAGTLRLAGSLRRYSSGDVHALALMRDEIARGLRARQAAESVRTQLTTTGPAAPFRQKLLTAAAQRDRVGVLNVLEDAQRALSLTVCVDEVLFPALRQVGLFWQTGRCNVEQEHLLTETICAWLRTIAHHKPDPRGHPPVLLVPAPNDSHTIGLQALHVLLKREGVLSLLLPTDTSHVTLSNALRQRQPRAVVFVCHLPSGRQRSVQQIKRAREGLTARQRPPAYFYAGNAFASARSRRAVPGQYLGTALGPAVELLAPYG